MAAIAEADLNIEVLLHEFNAASLPSEVVEVAPAVPEMNLPADAQIDVRYWDDEPDETVSVWIDHRNRLVRMRVIVFEGKEFKGVGLSEKEWASEAKDFNQAAHFGTFCLANPWGVTVEYCLPCHGGVFGEAIVFAVKRLAVLASDVRSSCTRYQVTRQAAPALSNIAHTLPIIDQDSSVVFFYEAAPEYMKLHRMQHEMTRDDVFIGTAFQVISPESMLPSERWRQHEKNGSLKIVWVMRLTRHAG